MKKDECIYLQEVSQKIFCEHMDKEDFFLTYGNPVVIRCDNGKKLVAISWQLAERLMCDNSDNDQKIKHWIYEFKMSEEYRRNFDMVCEKLEMTPDEVFEATIRNAIKFAEANPEEFKKSYLEDKGTMDAEIKLVRYYPVYKGETEAQALKRKMAEEAAEKEKG